MANLILYTYWRSSSSYRVRIALAWKGLAYEAVPVNLLQREQLLPEHRNRSATGYVPCLEVDGQSFIESVAIVELLEELYPDPPLYPKDPLDRARVRALVEIINAGTQPLQNLAVLERVSSDPDARRSWAQTFVGRGLAAFEEKMAAHARAGVSGPYAYGAQVTAADCFLVPQIYSAARFGVDLAPYPRVAAAAAAASSLPAFLHASPEKQPDAVLP